MMEAKRIRDDEKKPSNSGGFLKSEEREEARIERYLFLFMGLHIPFAILCYHVKAVSVAHELLVLLVGLWAVFTKPRDSKILFFTVAYIVGAEVLWRRTGAASEVAWEFGKYSVIFLLTLSMIVHPRRISVPVMMLIYMLLLLPSIFVVWNEDMSLLRLRVIGTLAGPLGLVVCSIYFYNMTFNERDVKRMLLVMLAPIVAVLIFAAYNTFLHRDILHFGKSANKIAAGGGGANQVANSLGLGALFCWLLLTTGRLRKAGFIIALTLLMALSFQMLLTFSRGGPFTFGLAAAVTIPLLLRGRTGRMKILLVVGAVLILGAFVVLPKINQLTEGKALERFSNLKTSRQELAAAEFDIWKKNFIFGVGPGFARYDVEDYLGVDLQAHVEFTRMLAEHGLFGLFALLILFYTAFENFLVIDSWKGRVWAAAFLVFTFVYMAQSATRQIAPGFLFGLTWARFYLGARKKDENGMLKPPATSRSPLRKRGVR